MIGATLLTGLLSAVLGAQAPREYVFEVFDRVGGLNAGPGLEFSGIMLSVARAPDGSTLVLDPLQSLIRRIDPNGSVSSFGGPGRGPGELRAPVAMLVEDDGDILVATAFDGRYTIYDADGRFRATEARSIRATNKNQFALARTAAGALIDQAPVAYHAMEFVSVVRGTPEALLRIGFPPRPSQIDGTAPVRPGSDWARTARSFLPFPVWALAADGTVWIVDPTEHRLRRQALNGDVLADVPLVHELEGFSNEEEDVIGRGLHEAGLSRRQVTLQRRSATAVIPNHSDASVLVQRAGEFSSPTGVLDHYASDGEWLGVLEVDAPVSPTAVHYFSRDTVYLVTSDRFDVPTIQMGVLATPSGGPNR